MPWEVHGTCARQGRRIRDRPTCLLWVVRGGWQMPRGTYMWYTHVQTCTGFQFDHLSTVLYAQVLLNWIYFVTWALFTSNQACVARMTLFCTWMEISTFFKGTPYMGQESWRMVEPVWVADARDDTRSSGCVAEWFLLSNFSKRSALLWWSYEPPLYTEAALSRSAQAWLPPGSDYHMALAPTWLLLEPLGCIQRLGVARPWLDSAFGNPEHGWGGRGLCLEPVQVKHHFGLAHLEPSLSERLIRIPAWGFVVALFAIPISQTHF